MGAEVKVVPLEPTPEMYGAGGVQQFKCDLASVPVRDAVGMVYRAMLAAAPAPTDEDPTTPEAQAGSEAACPHCNDTGFVAISARDGRYLRPGPVPDDARGVAESPCWECLAYPGGFDGPTGAD